MEDLEQLRAKHGQTMRTYLASRYIWDSPRQAITGDVLVAMADFVAFQLLNNEQLEVRDEKTK